MMYPERKSSNLLRQSNFLTPTSSACRHSLLQQLKFRRNPHGNNHKCDKNTHNPKEPPKPSNVLPRNRDVHAKHASNKMTRNENRREHGNLTQSRIDRKTNAQIRRTELRETIRLRPPDNLIDVRQRRQGRDEMVLHVAEVEQQITTREDRVFVRCLATLDEAV